MPLRQLVSHVRGTRATRFTCSRWEDKPGRVKEAGTDVAPSLFFISISAMMGESFQV